MSHLYKLVVKNIAALKTTAPCRRSLRAERAGVSGDQLSNWERGRKGDITLGTLEKLARGWGVSPEELLRG